MKPAFELPKPLGAVSAAGTGRKPAERGFIQDACLENPPDVREVSL